MDEQDRQDAKPKKTRVIALVPAELAERLRNAVDALSGPPNRLRLNATVAAAVEEKVVALEKKFNKGKPFPQREGELAHGRRV